MVSACEYCKKTKKGNKHLSFHRFPTDERVKVHWLKNMGRVNWNPSTESRLCSAHFFKDCIDFRDKVARLRKGSIPTIFDGKMMNTFPSQHNIIFMEEYIASRKIVKDGKVQESVNISQKLNDMPPLQDISGNIVHEGANINVDISRQSIRDKQLINDPQNTSKFADLNVVNRDHTYVMTCESLERKLNAITEKQKNLTKKFNALNDKYKRSVKTIGRLKDSVKRHQRTEVLLKNGFYHFKGFKNIPSEMFQRIHNNVGQSSLTKDKYPPSLRCFALTLHFYSPKAYKYVRESFQNALPCPSVLRSWYNNVDAELGFSDESFNALKEKSEEFKRNNNKTLICAFMMDEISIKEDFQRKGNGEVGGYVGIGFGATDNDVESKTTDALVMLVVPLDKTWKLPIAFFFIKDLTNQSIDDIINEALRRLNETGIHIASITLEGPPEHLSVLRNFDPVMTMSEMVKPSFPHPTKNRPYINVFIDPCHDLKTIRKALAEYEVIVDGNNNKIEWRFIKELALIQQSDEFHLENERQTTRVVYKKVITKLSSAAQTLSVSVADAIEYCWVVLKLEQFDGCEATVEFIRCVHSLFDFLKERNLWGSSYKSLLNEVNEHIWRPTVTRHIEYLAELKLLDDTPISNCTVGTGFLGFYAAVLSYIEIYEQYVKKTIKEEP